MGNICHIILPYSFTALANDTQTTSMLSDSTTATSPAAATAPTAPTPVTTTTTHGTTEEQATVATTPAATAMATTNSTIRTPTNPTTSVKFTRMPGNGWCQDAYRREETARKMVDTTSLEAALEQCQNDSYCAAFGFSREQNRSILYTSTGCTLNCQYTQWVGNPSLITQAGWCCDQTLWMDAVCYRKLGEPCCDDISISSTDNNHHFAMGMYKKQHYSHDGRVVYRNNNVFLYWNTTNNDWAFATSIGSASVYGYHNSCNGVCPSGCNSSWRLYLDDNVGNTFVEDTTMKLKCNAGDSSVTKLNGQNCSSQGYRMAESQSECEDIARHLGLADISAYNWNPHDCPNQLYYRCGYLSGALYWNPNCGDNSLGGRAENLCTQSGIWKLTETGKVCPNTIFEGLRDNLNDCQTHCETVGTRRLTFFPNNYCICCTASRELVTYDIGQIYTFLVVSCTLDEECGSERYCHDGICKQARCFCEYSNGFGVKSGILCEPTGNHHWVTECPQDHWCTGISNKSSQVVSAIDLCEKAAVSCGYGQYAPRCSLCKLAHRTEDDSYNSWCGGNCYFDQQDGQCKMKGLFEMSMK